MSERTHPHYDYARLPWLAAGWLGLITYLGWNIAWLSQGSLAPSLFKALFGLPAPTTGLTRSLFEMAAGNVHQALLWNPFTVPICALFAVTIALAVSVTRGTRPTLPPAILILWVVTLGCAWAAKFALGPRFW